MSSEYLEQAQGAQISNVRLHCIICISRLCEAALKLKCRRTLGQWIGTFVHEVLFEGYKADL